MAKKAPTDELPFSPVKSRLVHAVLTRPPIGAPFAPAPVPAAGVSRTLLRNAPDPHLVEVPICNAAYSYQSLTREKRVLVSETEESALNELVHRLASSGATSVKLSHLLRACIVILRHSETEIVEHVRLAERLVRPPNGSAPLLAEFERRLAKQVAAAIKEAPPLG